MRLAALILLAVALVFPANLAQAEVTGRARIIDGDTIQIQHQRIRLFGIDAPEGRQRCTANGKPWRCGQQSIFALAEFIGKAWVRCVEQGAEMLRRAVNKSDNDEATAFLYNRLTVLQWTIAEAPARSTQDMAVKVRLWRRSIENGTAVWDARLAETLLEALTE